CEAKRKETGLSCQKGLRQPQQCGGAWDLPWLSVFSPMEEQRARVKTSFASRLEDLRIKLEKEGYSNISYIVVNHQGISSQLKYIHLKNKVSDHIPVYQQEENQKDVWTLLNGYKDDFLIYDRCGHLVYHLGLPYSFLTFPYVEDAIKIAYCEDRCGNCSFRTLENEDFCRNVSLPTVEKTIEALQPHHHHNHQHLGSSELSKNQQPGAADTPSNPAPLDLHHHKKHKGQYRQGNSES
ncbi:Hypothetical predicted protein, partial [Marmota monax]